jgi:hypothetical protein
MRFIETPAGDMWNLEHIAFIRKRGNGWYTIVWDSGDASDIKDEALDVIRNAITAYEAR